MEALEIGLGQLRNSAGYALGKVLSEARLVRIMDGAVPRGAVIPLEMASVLEQLYEIESPGFANREKGTFGCGDIRKNHSAVREVLERDNLIYISYKGEPLGAWTTNEGVIDLRSCHGVGWAKKQGLLPV